MTFVLGWHFVIVLNYVVLLRVSTHDMLWFLHFVAQENEILLWKTKAERTKHILFSFKLEIKPCGLGSRIWDMEAESYK